MNAYENTEAQETLRDFAGQINEKLARVEGQLDRLLGTGLAEAIKGQPPMVGALAELRQILGDIDSRVSQIVGRLEIVVRKI